MRRKRLAWKNHGQKSRLIGITGTGNGVGCTHFSVMLLNYLAGFLRRKAVLLEWNDSGDFARLEKVCNGSCGEEKFFCILDAVYCKDAGQEELADAYEKGYEDILIDFGSMGKEEGWKEFLRCEMQYVVGSFSEWQQECFREFELTRQPVKRKSWVSLAVFGSEETRKEFLRRYRLKVERIPFSADAFSVTRECHDFFDMLLEKNRDRE